MKIKVYQIDSKKDDRRLAFMDSEFAEKHGGIRPSDYRCVFDGYTDAVTLEQVFGQLNSPERPGTYRGHSLSVSDIVEVTGDVQPNWDAFSATPLGNAYFTARLAVAQAFKQTLSDDMAPLPGILIDSLSDSAYVERQFLSAIVYGKPKATAEQVRPYLHDLIEEYAKKPDAEYIAVHGWSTQNVKDVIIRHLAPGLFTDDCNESDPEATAVCREVYDVSHAKDLSDLPTPKFIPCQAKGSFFCDSIGFKPITFESSQATPLQGVRCLEIQPGKPPFETRIPDELRSWQMAVSDHGEDSLMEVTYPFDDNAVVVGNEEAKLNGMAGNRRLYGSIYAGPIFIVGDNNGEFCDLTDRQIKEYGEQFAEPEDISPEEVQSDCGFCITGF